jgi:putative transcriptional regulator
MMSAYNKCKASFTLFIRGYYMKNRLRDLRNQFNMRQEDIALQVNVSRQTIISIENGRYSPSLELAYKLSKIFNLTIEEVFIFEEGGSYNEGSLK